MLLQDRMATNAWHASTVQALFRETCEKQADKTAIVFEDQRISYGELHENVNRISKSLLDLGVDRGDHVVMMPTSSPEFTYLYFAVLQIGARINPLNLLWGEIEFRGILPRNAPKLIVTVDEHDDHDYVRLLKRAIPDLLLDAGDVRSASVPSLTCLVSLSRKRARHKGFLDFQELLENGQGYDETVLEERVRTGRHTDIQFLCQTSGSTGLSKSALWTHAPPLATVHFMARSMNYAEEDTFINLAPYFHNSGLAAMNLALAYAGSTLFLMERFHPETAVKLIHEHEITTTFGFDAHWQAMNRVLQAARGSRRFTIRKAMGAITPRTYDMILNEMCEPGHVILSNLYAQTENGPGVSFMEPDCINPELRKHTNGRPLPGVELVIRDVDNQELLPPNKPGEICYKSPFCFSGYYKQDEETAKLFDEAGYLHSGDLGTFEGGYVRFLGRLGGVIKSGGENVSTTYVAALLIELFPEDFDDVQCVGVPDPYWGNRLVAWVKLRGGRRLRPTKQIRKDCKGRLADYEIPKAFLEWFGPWPVTEIGKLNLNRLQDEAEKRVGEAEQPKSRKSATPD